MDKVVTVFENPDYIWGGQVYQNDGYSVLASISPNAISELSEIHCKSGGVLVRFLSNAPKIVIRYSVIETEVRRFPQMGITAQRGLMFGFYDKNEQRWYNMDCCYSMDNSNVYEIDMTAYFAECSQREYEITIFCPIMCYITEMEIVCQENFYILPLQRSNKKMLALGGYNTFGAGITGSAFLWSSIISRKTNWEVRNISCYEENSMLLATKILQCIQNEIEDYEAIVVEYNSEEIIENRVVFETLRKEIMTYSDKITFITGEMCWKLENADFYTYDSNIANDAGHVCIYQKLRKLCGDNK